MSASFTILQSRMIVPSSCTGRVVSRMLVTAKDRRYGCRQIILETEHSASRDSLPVPLPAPQGRRLYAQGRLTDQGL